MTITLELTSEQEERLSRHAATLGYDAKEYLVCVINELPADRHSKGETLGDRLERLGVLGAFESKPRPDGRPWSEIEGYEFE